MLIIAKSRTELIAGYSWVFVVRYPDTSPGLFSCINEYKLTRCSVTKLSRKLIKDYISPINNLCTVSLRCVPIAVRHFCNFGIIKQAYYRSAFDPSASIHNYRLYQLTNKMKKYFPLDLQYYISSGKVLFPNFTSTTSYFLKFHTTKFIK